MRAPVFPAQAGCVRRRALNAGIVGGALAARGGTGNPPGPSGVLGGPGSPLPAAGGCPGTSCMSVCVCRRLYPVGHDAGCVLPRFQCTLGLHGDTWQRFIFFFPCCKTS